MPYLAQEGLDSSTFGDTRTLFLTYHKIFGAPRLPSGELDVDNLYHPGYDEIKDKRGWGNGHLKEGVSSDDTRAVTNPSAGTAPGNHGADEASPQVSLG